MSNGIAAGPGEDVKKKSFPVSGYFLPPAIFPWGPKNKMLRTISEKTNAMMCFMLYDTNSTSTWEKQVNVKKKTKIKKGNMQRTT